MGPNEKILRGVYANYVEAGMDAIIDAFDKEIIWRSNGAVNRLLFSGEHRGHEGIRAYAKARNAEWTMLEHELQEMFGVEDQRFVTRVRAAGQHSQTGVKVTITRVDFITMQRGLITSFEEIFDTAPLERAARPR